MASIPKREKAIVIGGSIAGLMTARVLSDYFEDVLVIDKDEFPDQPVDRAGVPHGFHPHRFTARGKMITEQLFPGYEEDLRKLGSPTSLNKTAHIMSPYGTVAGPYDRDDIKFSRAALEWVIRKRVKAISNVRYMPKHDVLSLLSTSDRAAVTGVRVRERGEQGSENEWLADLVVDASGRASKLTQWLEELGCEVPAADLMKASIGYSTRRYKVPAHKAHLTKEWDVINIMGQPAKGTFTGVFSFIENGVAEVVLYRPGGQYPPTIAEQFEEAIAALPSPLIAEILQDLEPVTPLRGFHVQELYRRHYEQVEKWPSGLLVIGDAFCIYDPIFGQGMTVVAIEADLLKASLQEHMITPQVGFEQRLLRKMQDEVITPTWWLNCSAVLEWEGVEYESASEPLKGIAFGRRFMDLVLKEGTGNHNYELFGMYWAVNTLSVPLRELYNLDRVSAVLQASDEGRQLLAELLEEHGLPLEDVLDKIIPH
ncbi:NAD(P)/FAD-dependent oxidoreductase [Bacillus sp. FJAT-26390]|uniref:FAD-dependent oxidoreductase n=1 Tax=Bacillus sp. FJAT-26390 TaxID=1743142 RepID=UPI000807C821|nr:FAD dependent oxidoreductase [Bacillus sp. FJAT-26390]OBZ12536.1 FAD dependent oxidoreductase [Bacillus sp. FJAT-26390]